MTHDEAKDRIAQKHHFESWLELKRHTPDLDNFDKYCSQVSELYARSKWDEACEACAELACVDNIGTDGEAYILNHKPEFKI